jgi:hypothetical protein
MAATDLSQSTTNGHDAPPSGPSDREVVEALQRVASAQAHLRLAEAKAREMNDPQATSEAARRSREIEAARVEILWAQAALLRPGLDVDAEQALAAAAREERAVLSRHGFGSFRDYLHQRNEVPTTDTHLALARREATAAQTAWAQLQRAMTPTVIIDLTGDEPRIL